MKKTFIAFLVVAMAAPAWANIAISVTDLGDGKAAIDYSGTELARAFALDITVDAGVIEAISDFARGDNNSGYGIFPANFSRNIVVDPDTGEVSDWGVDGYNPVASADDPGALGGLGTSGITIEMGSLYDTQAPPLSGRLCVITCSESCQVTVTTNATRGNVVLEDASEASVNLAAATAIPIRGSSVAYTGPHPEQWMAVGQPDCWLSSINPRQCRGDADGAAQGANNFWVSTNDLDILIAAWNKTFEQLQGQTVGDIPLICADFDHQAQGNNQYRVSTNDLDILIANWQVANAPAPDCP
jgi:hypothetical protein